MIYIHKKDFRLKVLIFIVNIFLKKYKDSKIARNFINNKNLLSRDYITNSGRSRNFVQWEYYITHTKKC